MKKAFVTLFLAMLLIAIPSASAVDSLGLKIVSSTSTTVTIGWTPPANAAGYLFWANGSQVGSSLSGAKSQYKFARAACDGQADCYQVKVLTVTAIGGSTGQAPKPAGDTTAPSAPPNLRVYSSAQDQIVLRWDPATDNVGVVNYRIYRDGSMIGQGAGSSGGLLDQWTDKGRTCGTSYSYAVEAQDAAGNTSPRSGITAATSPCPTPAPVACADGLDNDGDGLVDLADPGCSSSTDTDETDPAPAPTGTITEAQCDSMASVAGTVIANVTVSGGCTVTASNVTFKNVTVNGGIEMRPNVSGTQILGSRMMSFYIFGADNTLVDGSTIDCQGKVKDGAIIWDEPAGNYPNGFTIRNSRFQNCIDVKADDHSQAIYIGYSANGLIENNTFEYNGSTSHIFFTNFGNQFDANSYPRNICIRGNTFGRTYTAYFDINFHANVSSLGPTKTQIRIDPGNVMPSGVTDPEFIIPC